MKGMRLLLSLFVLHLLIVYSVLYIKPPNQSNYCICLIQLLVQPTRTHDKQYFALNI